MGQHFGIIERDLNGNYAVTSLSTRGVVSKGKRLREVAGDVFGQLVDSGQSGTLNLHVSGHPSVGFVEMTFGRKPEPVA